MASLLSVAVAVCSALLLLLLPFEMRRSTTAQKTTAVSGRWALDKSEIYSNDRTGSVCSACMPFDLPREPRTLPGVKKNMPASDVY